MPALQAGVTAEAGKRSRRRLQALSGGGVVHCQLTPDFQEAAYANRRES